MLEKTSIRHRHCGNARGQQVMEFAAFLVVIVVCIVLPLANLSIVPVRFGLARNLVANRVHQLSLFEKFSAACKNVDSNSRLGNELLRLGGSHLKLCTLVLCVTSPRCPGAGIIVDRSGNVPAAWLPDGANAPCDYSLRMTVEVDVDPLVTVPVAGHRISGINGPIACTIVQTSHWENLGRDPATGQFYLNE
jgi:hypothetical protein